MADHNNHPNRALVTGASGFVGRHLVNRLLETGDKVIATGSDPENPFQSQDITYIAVDLLDERAMAAAIDFRDIDVVYHLAALATVGPSFANPNLYAKTNISIEVSLFEVCKKQAVKPKVLIISSSTVYDGGQQPPISEQSPLLPASPYAASKLGQESFGLYYLSQGFEVVIARPFNHIGPGQQPGFLVPDLAKQIAELEQTGGGSLKVGNLQAKRDYTDVRDVVRAYQALTKNGTPGEIYNVCSGRSVSGQTILDGLLALSQVSIKAEVDPGKLRPNEVPDIYGSADKIKASTGWAPEIAIDQTLADTLEYWRSQQRRLNTIAT